MVTRRLGTHGPDVSTLWLRAMGAGKGFRRQAPRFDGENLAANVVLVDALVKVAHSIGTTVAQVSDSRVEDVNAVAEQVREDFVNRVGFGELR